jgi:signal transduction histidine kinase
LQEIKDLLPPSNLNDNAEEILILLEQLEKNLAKIQQHSGRINRIASSMLLHAREGSGLMEPTDVNQLISEFVNLAFHGMRAGKNPINVDIKLELDYNINMIPLQAEDFSRVILNLCNNAFDALREKSIKLSEGKTTSNSSDTHAQLILRSKLNGKWIIVEVEDNGLGIPKNHQDKIFEPFFTTKNKTQGTGLGLSITKDIIESHRGELMIDSKEGYFTKFIIKIPNQ